MVAECTAYDGNSVIARVGVHARGGPITVDRRMWQVLPMRVESVRACDGPALTFWAEDSFPAPRAEDPVELQDGQSYEREVEFKLFLGAIILPGCGDAQCAQGPDCVEVTLAVSVPPGSITVRCRRNKGR